MPGSLRSLDAAAVAVARRVGAVLGAPARRLSRWERGRPPGVVRSVVAHPGLVAVLAGVVVVLAAGVHLARFPSEVAAPEPDVVGRAPTEIGPPAGVDLDAYVARRHELLADLTDAQAQDELRAVVSFEELVPLDELPLPDEDVRVERVQLLLPGELEPRWLVADDDAAAELEQLLEEGRGAIDEEIAELEQLLEEDLGDPAFEEEFLEQLEMLRELRDQASADADVVFAAVVVAPGSTLQELTDAPGIRAVDPAGLEELTRGTRMVGIPPDLEERAAEGAEGAERAAPATCSGPGC